MRFHAYLQIVIFFLTFGSILMLTRGLQAQQKLPEGFDKERHMLVSEVKHEQQGYALTIFEGVKIEALPVRVISVENSSSPGKSLVWVECTSERMKHIGPVQGMSGSPVFLWDEDTPEEERVLGEGGRMLGALAFGYSMTRDTWCAFGVQPIQYMLAAGQRTEVPKENTKAKNFNRSSQRSLSVMRYFSGLDQNELELTELDRWRLEKMSAMMKLSELKAQQDKAKTSTWKVPQQIAEKSNITRPWITTMNVGSSETAKALSGLFQGTGIQPIGFNAPGGGEPPQWIDPDSIKPVPGGVLSVPIVSGDADWASIGTITEVLPDGTVLGFGHAMFGQGKLRMPLSTGFVHFIHPSMQNSFKLGGSLKQVGAVLNDEQTAIVGKPKVSSPWVPIKVTVKWPDPSDSGKEMPAKSGEYEYQVVDHPDYLARALPFMAAYSMTSDTGFPERFTIKYSYKLKFEGDRDVEIKGTMPMMTPNASVAMPASVIDAMTNSNWGKIKLISAEAEMEVVEEDLSVMIESVRIDKRKVKPGETITATLKLRKYRQEPYFEKIQLKIPEDAEEGRWSLAVGGALAYYDAFFSSNPYLLSFENIDELMEAYQALFQERSSGLFMVAVSPKTQVSLGRKPLPPMPSSRLMTLLDTPNARVGAWRELFHTEQESDLVYRGGRDFTITVSKSD